MQLLLLRHALTPETGTRLTGRRPGVALSDEGRQQAAALGKALARLPVKALYTSPVQRCRETAKLVGADWGLQPVSYGSFTEVDYGTWTGRTMNSLRRTKLFRMLYIAPSRVTFPGGESLANVQARAVAACEDLASRHSKEMIAVVSHGDVIKSVLAHYLGTHLDLFQRIQVSAASASMVALGEGTAPAVLFVNDVPGRHLA